MMGVIAWRKLVVSHCWLRYVGPEKGGLGPEKGAGWHWMEERVADRRPFPSHFPTNGIALHRLPDKIIAALSPSLFAGRVPRGAFCPRLTVESPLAFHNWITLVSGPHPAPLGWGAEMKEQNNLVNRPLAQALIHTLPDMKIQAGKFWNLYIMSCHRILWFRQRCTELSMFWKD